MSYCRWSTDQFRSDVYCYEAGHGFVIHVAANRLVSDQPRPERKTDGVSWDDPRWVDLSLEDWNALDAWCKAARREPITLEHAGEELVERTAGECADRLRYLRGLGYCVPQQALEALDEEAAEVNTLV
jgi:hypothetical protein